MTIWNLGSINADHTYRVDKLPVAGETLASRSLTVGLGGKGANMSVAAARAAARVCHIGAVGEDGTKWRDRLLEYGVDTRFIAVADEPTAHAIITVDDDGENQIILYSGANGVIPENLIGSALSEANAGDIFVTQNETNGQYEAAKIAKELGLRVMYAAAPFSADAIMALDGLIDILVLNEVEAGQLQDATGKDVSELGIAQVLITKGADGVTVYDNGTRLDVPAVKVDAVDTTGAGDTFTGYFAAGLDRGFGLEQSLNLAVQAAAIMVTRHGTADVIPDLKDVQDAKL
ncbi:MAG: ribokinase [Nereida ignava]|uniref:ribokinase n=1 Tax=Nereida ignava TaxID=282199 RepID=UPI0030FBDB99